MNINFIDNELISLKKLDQNDVTEKYIQWMNDPEVNRYMETRFFPHTKADIEEFVQNISSDPNSVLFGIYDKIKSQHIGNIKLGPINWIHRKAIISLFIGEKDFWGKGYAASSIELVSEYAFKVLNLHKIEAGAYAENVGSIKAFEKNGYVIEGCKKDECIIDNTWMDVVIMSKINSSEG